MTQQTKKLRVQLFAALMAGCTMSLTGCFNDDYDLNEVDMTVGIGGGELQIPTSSTDTITLADVLDLKEGDCVEIADNGDYVFRQKGGDVAPVKASIAKIVVAQKASQGFPFAVDFEKIIGGPLTAPNIPDIPGLPDIPEIPNIPDLSNIPPVTIPAQIQMFQYKEAKPKEVVDLDRADVNAEANLYVPFAVLKDVLPSVDNISLTFPKFLVMEVTQSTAEYTMVDNVLSFDNMSTANDLSLTLKITALDFNKSDDKNVLEIKDDFINVMCNIDMSMTISPSKIDIMGLIAMANKTVELNTSMSMSDNFTINGAVGRFNPTIDMTDLGNVNITGVPEFLTNEQVVVDLYNPQLLLTIESNLDIEGFVSGTIVANKNGAKIAEVDIPEIKINAAGTTTKCICRVATDELIASYGAENVVVIPNLSEVVKTIPDNIAFEAKARANDKYTAHFELDKEYSLTPQYSFEAPIAFAHDATIVYEELLDDLHKDLEDIELSDNSYVEVNAEVINKVPAYLKLDAIPVDVNGNEMSKDEIEVITDNTIIAYDGNDNPKVSPIKLVLKQTRKGALQKLDALKLVVTASASDNSGSVTGITLNSKEHFIIADNIKIKVVGQLIADLN